VLLGTHLDLDFVVDVFVGHVGGLLVVCTPRVDVVGREWHGFTSHGSQNHVSEMFEEVRVGGAMREDLGFLNQIVGLNDSATSKVHSFILRFHGHGR
jgi:hypothetical protein